MHTKIEEKTLSS